MTQEQIFELWGKVLKGDEDAKKVLIGLFLSKFPESAFLTHQLTKDNLHMMYLHLYNGDPKNKML